MPSNTSSNRSIITFGPHNLNLNISHTLLTYSKIINTPHCLSLMISFVRRMDETCLGDLVDGSLFLKSLNVWGCTQLSLKFFDGIRNQVVNVVGKMDAV